MERSAFGKSDMSIDSYRFLDFASRQVMTAWAARQKPGVIPLAPLTKPLGECKVALVSTAGVARVVLPMRRLAELAAAGIVGQPAPRQYSIIYTGRIPTDASAA